MQTAPQACGLTTAARACAAVRGARRRVACSPPACSTGSSASRTTGATTRSSASQPFMQHCALAPLEGTRRPVRRDPLARLRRGRADAPRRLAGVAGARPAGQLRTAAAEPARRTAARPPLVPGQPAERAPDRRARPARRAPRDARDRRDGLSVGAAVAGLRAARCGAVADGRLRRSSACQAPCRSRRPRCGPSPSRCWCCRGSLGVVAIVKSGQQRQYGGGRRAARAAWSSRAACRCCRRRCAWSPTRCSWSSR